MSYSANNHKVPDMTAKRKFVLRFGSDKFANDMHVAQIKAIYGKHVKEGKLTLEDKSNVKVLIKATASECQRLMKTLTTLKGAPKEVQNTHLAGLGCCSKCAAKHAATTAKGEERQKKIVAAQLAQAEAELQRKRKREQTEVDRDGEKTRKLSEQLQRVEDMRVQKEAAKEDIARAKVIIEEKREAARAEKADLTRDVDSLAEQRKATAGERSALETERNELATLRARLETQKQRAESDATALGAQLEANKATLLSLEVAKKAVEKERLTIVKERERVEAETVKYEEARRTLEQKKAAWEEVKKYKDDEQSYKAAAADRRRAEASAKENESAMKKAQRDVKTANNTAKQAQWAKDYERWESTGAASGAPEYPSPSGSPTGASPDAARFYGDAAGPASQSTKAKFKAVIDDDDDETPEKSTADVEMEEEEDAEREAKEFAASEQRARELSRKRQEEVARQAREKLAATQADAAAEKQRARKQGTKKAQKDLLDEMRRKQEEDAAQREHHARMAHTERQIREKARSTCVATATDAIYEAHVLAFEAMKNCPPGALKEKDIPWPHPNNLCFFTPRDDHSACKKKVMRAIQRWHPDKFTQNFGAAIKETERERIMTRVRGVSASVIELRQVYN